MDNYHPLLIPNFENANTLLPLLNAKGKCNYCGLWPLVVLDDRDQAADFPTGHTSHCIGTLRGLTAEMDADATLAHLKERFGKQSAETVPAAKPEQKRKTADAAS